MEPIKINLTSKMDTYKRLSVKSITERDDLLIIELYNNESRMLKKNMNLHFTRNIYNNEKNNFLLTESVRILRKDNDGKIYTTKIPNKKLYLRSDNKKIRSVVYDDKTFIIETTVNHGIYPQDISQGTLYIELKNYKDEILEANDKLGINIFDIVDKIDRLEKESLNLNRVGEVSRLGRVAGVNDPITNIQPLRSNQPLNSPGLPKLEIPSNAPLTKADVNPISNSNINNSSIKIADFKMLHYKRVN